MSTLSCYKCGESLDVLSLPLSRLDECPSCSVYLHCCRMCLYFDPAVTQQCVEEDAEEVLDKKRANYCDYFKPATGRFDSAAMQAEDRARHSLDALFGVSDSGDDEPDGPDSSSAAEDLFR